jgi:hypothetical protein
MVADAIGCADVVDATQVIVSFATRGSCSAHPFRRRDGIGPACRRGLVIEP